MEKIELTLTLPEALLGWIQSRPWLRVARAELPSIAWGRWSMPLALVRIASSKESEQLLEHLEQLRTAGGAIPLLIGSFIRSSLRGDLERRGLGYLDRRGNLHLPWPNGIIHIEAGVAARMAVSEIQEAGLGVHGVRAVQALLADGDEQQVSHLAGVAQLSVSRAHAVLRLLESKGLVRVTGRGPATRRHVIDRSQLLDWLVAQPVARRRERQVDLALYGRTPGDVWRLITERLDHAQIPHGLTGSAAAAALASGPTSVMVSCVRISPHFPLDDAVTALGGEKTERGANVRLIRDTGMLGSARTILHEHVRIAPLVRVYLDALDERRGDEIAQGFRERVLGY